MYLEIIIKDENGITKEVSISRDGSDSEALELIQDFLDEEFDDEDADVYDVVDYDTSDY